MVDIYACFVLFSDLLVNDIAVFLERKSLIVVYWNLDSPLCCNQLFLVVKLREVRVLKDFFDRDTTIWVEFHHFPDKIKTIVTGMWDELTSIALLYLSHQFEHLLTS